MVLGLDVLVDVGCVALCGESERVGIGENYLMEGRVVQLGASHVAGYFHLTATERE